MNENFQQFFTLFCIVDRVHDFAVLMTHMWMWVYSCNGRSLGERFTETAPLSHPGLGHFEGGSVHGCGRTRSFELKQLGWMIRLLIKILIIAKTVLCECAVALGSTFQTSGFSYRHAPHCLCNKKWELQSTITPYSFYKITFLHHISPTWPPSDACIA